MGNLAAVEAVDVFACWAEREERGGELFLLSPKPGKPKDHTGSPRVRSTGDATGRVEEAPPFQRPTLPIPMLVGTRTGNLATAVAVGVFACWTKREERGGKLFFCLQS
jgi:tRNA(Leu) C34 or U34 (ribose-2'-O)-methylase TrmL